MERNSAGRFQSGRTSRPTRGGARHSADGESHAWVAAGIGTLIGGAVLGTVAMYLLDPEEGERRRAAAREMARRALEKSTEAASSAYAGTAHLMADAIDAARHKAAEAGSATADAMPNGKHLRANGAQLLDEARELPSQLKRSLEGWIETARGYLPRHGWRAERHSDYAMNPAAVSATALGTFAVGAATMWVMDPRLGRARRAWLGQKAGRVLHEIGDFARATGRHLRNRAKGTYHDTASAVSDAVHRVKGRMSGEHSDEESMAENSSS